MFPPTLGPLFHISPDQMESLSLTLTYCVPPSNPENYYPMIIFIYFLPFSLASSPRNLSLAPTLTNYRQTPSVCKQSLKVFCESVLREHLAGVTIVIRLPVGCTKAQ